MAANAMNDAISTNPDSPATANLQWFNGINDVAGLHQKESFITARVFCHEPHSIIQFAKTPRDVESGCAQKDPV
jgi:hypothetical protein